jgi:glycine dehydrogenase subunit 2
MNIPDRDRRLLMDRSVPGRTGAFLAESDVPKQELPPKEELRKDLKLPEVSEGDVVRYFTNLSQMNFSVDTNYYPLGSCTMKYNPKINDELASLEGFAHIHPLEQDWEVQGALELMYHLQSSLSQVVGLENASLSTMAGAQGELAGMLMIRAYHRANGDEQRKIVLVPDSAHGTNPASASMAGYQVVTVASDDMGNMDLNELKRLVSNEVAGLMLTLPNTLGLFDNNIHEICNTIHEYGGLVYGDGANMNALMGHTLMGPLGFDVLHLNLHKTFSTPHGGGGPGAGPILASARMAPFLPTPIVAKSHSGAYSLVSPQNSIGKLGGFHGNFGVLLRAYAYIRSMGSQGIREISSNAIINANYILCQLKDYYDLPYDRLCMHEVIISAKWQKPYGIRALDIAKRLIDHRIHPPTMYFPLTVDEALMIEPTETESKETIDHFIEVMREIAKEAVNDPQLLKEAPHYTPNTRLDEAKAARKPNLRWSGQ